MKMKQTPVPFTLHSEKYSSLKTPVFTGLQASLWIDCIEQWGTGGCEGLYLLAYGLEGALLLGFCVVAGNKLTPVPLTPVCWSILV